MNSSVVIDTTHGLIPFAQLAMQVKTASSEATTKPQPVITDEALATPPTTTEKITAFIDYPSKCNTTSPVTPLEKFTETPSLLTSHWMSTKFDENFVVKVTKKTESLFLIKNNTQVESSP